VGEPGVSESRALVTSDGLRLTGELAPARGDAPNAAMVLCHPHPQFGGSMRSLVISELFAALPALGVTCIRFDFRGVGSSEGEFDGGDAERLDVHAALSALRDEVDPALPIVLLGWSFGADVALSIEDSALAAWIAIACPLRWTHDLDVAANDPRPKLLLLGANDEYRTPGEVIAAVDGWTNTTVQVVGGASHFFVGRTDVLTREVAAFADRVVNGRPQ
jgi:alpha/beta superfamily hydrolase